MAKAAKESNRKTAKIAGSKKSAAKAEPEPQAETEAQPPEETRAEPAPGLDNSSLPATAGKVGVFGGPKDRGNKPEDRLALPTGPHHTYELIRSLNPKGFYCAMRWDYRIENKSPEEGKRWWANKRLRVTNPKSGASVVVRAVDYGPHTNTGLDISVSPGAAAALGVEVGDEVEISFADQRAPLGPEAGIKE